MTERMGRDDGAHTREFIVLTLGGESEGPGNDPGELDVLEAEASCEPPLRWRVGKPWNAHGLTLARFVDHGYAGDGYHDWLQWEGDRIRFRIQTWESPTQRAWIFGTAREQKRPKKRDS